jgi:type VI secretion system secreted protein Hcp
VAFEFYVTIEASKQGKLQGESPRDRKGDKLTGLAFHYSVGSPRDTASGMAMGKRIHQPVSFVKEWGAASPQLFTALTTNEPLKTVLFEFVRTNDSGEEYVFHTIKLLNAVINEIEQYVDLDSTRGQSGASGPLEKVTMSFQRIELENIDGKTSATDDLKGQR